MLGAMAGVLGEVLAVAGFGVAGYVIAAPEPRRWRLRPAPRSAAPSEPGPARSRGYGFVNSRPPRRFVASAAVGIGLVVVTSWPVMLVIGAAGTWFLPRLLASDGGTGAQIEKIEAIATFAELLRDTLAAAAGLGQAIAAAADCAAAPIEAEAMRLAVIVQDRTVPIDRALRAFAEQIADPAADEIAMALMFAARNSASDLASLLSRLAAHIRAEAAMNRRILVAGARKQTAVRLITAITLGMGVVLFVFGGRLMAPYDTLLGQCVLLVVSGLFAAGYLWLLRLSKPSTAPRLLRGVDVSGQPGVRIPAQARATDRRAVLAAAATEGSRDAQSMGFHAADRGRPGVCDAHGPAQAATAVRRVCRARAVRARRRPF